MERIRIIDTHTHYSHPKFDYVRDELLGILPKHGITTVIEAAIGFDSNFKMLELCDKYPSVYAVVGVHPNCVEELDEEKIEKLTQMLEHEKVLAVGETGLDYSKRNDEKFIALQKKWFVRFIELAMQKKMPLVIHCREMEAYDDLVEILSGYDFENHPGIIHCFSGNAVHAEKLIAQGFLLGIGGNFLKNVDNKEEVKTVIKGLPMESLVLETDAPYLKPDALPGKKNTSLNLKYIVEELAKLKEFEETLIYENAWNNTIKLYPVLEEQ